MSIEQFSPQHLLWNDYLAHTARHNMRRWLVDDNDYGLPDLFYLGYIQDNTVVGHLALKRQIIEATPTPWAVQHNHDCTIYDTEGIPLNELFVQTFAVDEAYRRQGIGLKLQQQGIALGQALGCYQVRSWSSLDKSPNYQLKIKLGFAIHPGFYELASGERISGVYFVKDC